MITFILLYIIPMVISIAGALYLRHRDGALGVSRADLAMICVVALIPLLNFITTTGVIIDLNEPYKDWWSS